MALGSLGYRFRVWNHNLNTQLNISNLRDHADPVFTGTATRAATPSSLASPPQRILSRRGAQIRSDPERGLFRHGRTNIPKLSPSTVRRQPAPSLALDYPTEPSDPAASDQENTTFPETQPKPMEPKNKLVLLAGLLAFGSAEAQTVARSSDPTAPAKAVSVEEKAIVLNPFVVNTDKDTGYQP
ncbi:MAG: hypothetical protein EXS40_07540 [Opitutaceae bacterium]|nr:hypothetical protein [Opitutaceae bacterium]